MPGTRPKNDDMTLCWSCAKACGGCSWTEVLPDGTIRWEPVAGWTATKRQMRVEKRTEDSYTVRKCPEYVREQRHKYRYIDEDGVFELARKVLTTAGRDYADASEDIEELLTVPDCPKVRAEIAERKGTMELIERFFRGGNLFTELLCLDGDALIDGIRK